MRNNIWLAVFAGLGVLATTAAGQQPNGAIQREKMTERAEEDAQTQKNAELIGGQGSALESELKKAEDRAQLAEKMANSPHQDSEQGSARRNTYCAEDEPKFRAFESFVIGFESARELISFPSCKRPRIVMSNPCDSLRFIRLYAEKKNHLQA